MAYADLGGLGLRQGTPEMVDWKASSMVPAAIPWLIVLVLLALPGNRCYAAWWIWVPLLCVGGSVVLPQLPLPFMPSSQVGMFMEWIAASGFGVAAVWLLAGLLAGKHRALTFLGMLAIQAVLGGLAFVLMHGADPEAFAMVIPVALAALVLAAALSLAGRRCRGHYGWLRLSLWLVLMVAVFWAVVITPFFIFAFISSGGRVPIGALLVSELMATGLILGIAAPFLVLAFVNGFYRERLKGLLHLTGEAPPVIPAAPPPAAANPMAATNP